MPVCRRSHTHDAPPAHESFMGILDGSVDQRLAIMLQINMLRFAVLGEHEPYSMFTLPLDITSASTTGVLAAALEAIL